MSPCSRVLAVVWSIVCWSAISAHATSVHLVFDKSVGELELTADEIAANLTASLYLVACLQRYSILNRSNNYITSPPPIPIIEIGSVALDATDGVASAVLTGYSMMSFTLTSNATVDLLMYLANVDMGKGGLTNVFNPVHALGVVGGQLTRPQDVSVDDTLSVGLTVGLGVVVFVVFSAASIISSRRRLIQESRGINFNDLIRLETELYEDADRRLMLL